MYECIEKPLTAEMTETARPLLTAVVVTERQPATEYEMDYIVLLLALFPLLVSDNYYQDGLFVCCRIIGIPKIRPNSKEKYRTILQSFIIGSSISKKQFEEYYIALP